MAEKGPLRTLASALPKKLITLVDVGSINGLKDRWTPVLPCVRSIGFDPREEEPVVKPDGDAIYATGVGATKSEATLYVTKLGLYASLLRPSDLLLRYKLAGPNSRVVSEQTVSLDSLDNILSGQQVDALKIDTQGTELEILKGGIGLLRDSVLLAEIECSFIERYEGQPLFEDIAKFMRQQGFDFIDIVKAHRYRQISSRDRTRASGSMENRIGTLAYGDVLFIASYERLEEKYKASSEKELLALKTLLMLLVYGKSDIASRLLDQWSGSLSPEHAGAFARYLDALSQEPVGGRDAQQAGRLRSKKRSALKG